MNDIPPETQALLNQIKNIDISHLEAEVKQPEKIMAQSHKGLSAISHIASGIFVGVSLGYGFDMLLGTKPFGLIVFMIIGFVAGMVNMVRVLESEDKSS